MAREDRAGRGETDGESDLRDPDAGGTGSRGSAGGEIDRPSRARPPRYEPPAQSEFGWRGWVLVAVVVVSFLVVPATVLYLPQAEWAVVSLGLSLRQAYLVLPLVPAVLLGATAVWAAVRSRSD